MTVQLLKLTLMVLCQCLSAESEWSIIEAFLLDQTKDVDLFSSNHLKNGMDENGTKKGTISIVTTRSSLHVIVIRVTL